MSRYFGDKVRRRALHMPGSLPKRKAPGRPRHMSEKREEDFFLVVNLMWGVPEVGKNVEGIRDNYRANPGATLKLRNVRGWLLRSEVGREFIALAVKHGYVEGNCFNLYRRYAHWYFRQEADNANQAASGTDRTGA